MISRTRRRRVTGLLLLLGTSVPTARAETPALAALAYQSEPGAGCPVRTDFVESVRREFGSTPFGEGARQRVEVSIRSQGSQLQASVRFSSEQLANQDGAWRGEQLLTAPRGQCTELAKTAALVVAFALDRLLRRPAPVEPAAATRPVEALASPPMRPLLTDGARDPRPAWELRLGGGPALTLGSTPGAAWATHLSLGLERRPVGLALEGEAAAPTRIWAPTGGGAAVSRKGVQAGACLVAPLPFVAPRAAPPAFYGCALVGASVLRSVGLELEGTRVRFAPFGTVTARGGVRMASWGRLSLRADVGVSALLARVPLRIDGREIWRQSPLGLTAFLRLESLLSP